MFKRTTFNPTGWSRCRGTKSVATPRQHGCEQPTETTSRSCNEAALTLPAAGTGLCTNASYARSDGLLRRPRYPELPWGAPPSWQIPEMRGAKFMQVWEMLSFLACLYVSATVPWLVAFSDDAFPGVHSCIYLSDPMTGPLLAIAMIDVAVDLLFTVDIIINFHLAIWEISTNGSPHWQLIDDLPTIRSKYIRGGLWTDVLGQIPWQYLDCVLPVHSDGLRLLRYVSNLPPLSISVRGTTAVRVAACKRDTLALPAGMT
jgi:hypothetical protein